MHESWVAFFSTDVNATVADILELVSARFSIETCFRDVKEIVGAGQQQVRKLSTNVGSFHVCLWAYVLTEMGLEACVSGLGQTSGWHRRGTAVLVAPATQTNAAHFAWKSWAKQFERLYLREQTKRK